MSAPTLVEPDLLRALRSGLPPDAVQTGDDEVEAVATDRSGHRLPGRPLAVVHPSTVAQVQAVVVAAAAAGVTVVTRGSGTGLSAGAAVPDGALVLSTLRLNRILEIAPDDEIAVVQPGVITDDLDAAAAEHGLMYAPDPASSHLSTIGGNIATNAGGLHCTKYGVTRESVLGLTVVLADGTVLRTGHRTIKGVAGYDLTSLFVGSEGTLGVVVEAVIRLRPRPVQTATLAAFFPTLDAAAAGVLAVVRSRVQASVVELLDGATMAGIDAAQGTALARRGGALLLVQTDGYGADREAAVLTGALSVAGATVDELTPEQAERHLWLRRSGRVFSADHWYLGEDVAVPRSRLVEMIRLIERIGECHGMAVSVVAHAGDGNLHPTLSLPRTPADLGRAPAVLARAADELVRGALRLGGTVTGEHGVGIAKRPWLAAEIGAEGLARQRGVKAVFDPAGLFNPHTWLARADDVPDAPHAPHAAASAVV